MVCKADILILLSVCGLLLTNGIVAKKSEQTIKDSPEPKQVMQSWQIEPKIPDGWDEIDRKQAKISNKKNFDVFVLMTDGKNDQIVWFEKIGRHWKMSVIESVPSERHVEYGVNIKEAGLEVKGNEIYFGIDGTEAISSYKWDTNIRLFIRVV